MKLNNIVVEWAKIATPVDGKYSITLKPTPEQQIELENWLKGIWNAEMPSSKEPAWLGGKKELEDGSFRFVANRRATRLVNEVETPNPLKVYDRQAKEYTKIPLIANGAVVNVNLHAAITEYQRKKGVSLFLNSIQLVSFEEWGSDGFDPIDEELLADIPY